MEAAGPRYRKVRGARGRGRKRGGGGGIRSRQKVSNEGGLSPRSN